MNRNIGSLDAIIRVVLGIGLLGAWILFTPMTLASFGLALVVLARFGTALAGYCLLYASLGISTCGREPHPSGH